jgi:hypothetical protein
MATPSHPHTYVLNHSTEGIKILGVRHAKLPQGIAMDWTCSGIEFSIDLNTDTTVSFVACADSPCYFKAFVDGTHWKNGEFDYFLVNTADTTLELTTIPTGRHTIRLLKITGYTLATAQVLSVTLDGTISAEKPADKDLCIEFLGDSICCGWGTIGNHTGNYTDQDGTLAYPYLVAKKFDTDYSIMALSGKGVIYGMLNFNQNYLHASPTRSNEEYDFARKADLTIINLGTNDRGQHVPLDEFEVAYLRLLENVLQKNGENCFILCLWGAMNNTYSEQIKAAIVVFLAKHPAARLDTLVLAPTSVPGGAPSWGHPRPTTTKNMHWQLKISFEKPIFFNPSDGNQHKKRTVQLGRFFFMSELQRINRASPG